MNHIHFFTNRIQQAFAQLLHPTPTETPVLQRAHLETVSSVALARISDANTSSFAPPANARSPSPAACSSDPRTLLERFVEELRLWCEEKSGSQEYPKRIEARERMIECFKTSSASLSLSGLALTSLPRAIGLLTKLRNLYLSNNRFTSFPDAINALSCLQILDLSRNQLITLPAAIGLLSNLQTLDLSDNMLTALPSAIGSLTDLKALSISYNKLSELPATIGLLTKLTMLNLFRNRLTALPDAISSLTRMERITLDLNQLTTLPDGFGFLRNLQSITLSDNPLTSLPDSILSLNHDCLVDLSETALSAGVLTHLREETARALYHGPQFSYSMPRISVPHEQPLNDMISELYRVIGQPKRTFPSLEAIDQDQHLRSWLNRLSYTATYQRGGDAKRQFVSQIVRYLETAEENEEFRSILMPILEDASQTCGDRVALSILHVGVGHRLHHFDLNDPMNLSQFLIHGPMTLSILEQYARAIIPTLRLVDQIEVYLGLPIMLKDLLNIPIDVSEMLYFQCSNLKSSHLEAAATLVREQIDDLEKRYQFLIGQPKWLAALEKRFPSEMAAIQEEYLQKLESASDSLSVRSEYEGHLKALTKQLLQK